MLLITIDIAIPSVTGFPYLGRGRVHIKGHISLHIHVTENQRGGGYETLPVHRHIGHHEIIS